jgi:hypothetical protein
MTLSSTQIAKINKMNKASQVPSLGTIIAGLQTSVGTLEGVNKLTSGSYAAVAADASGSSMSILTGTTTIKGFIAPVATRSGSFMYHLNVNSSTGSKLVVTTAGSPIAAGDVVTWIVF